MKGSLTEGLSSKESFTPEASSPPEVKVKGNSRPKHDNKMIKRKTSGGKSYSK